VNQASQGVAAASSGVDGEEVAVDRGKRSVVLRDLCRAAAPPGHRVVKNRLARQGDLGPDAAAGVNAQRMDLERTLRVQNGPVRRAGNYDLFPSSDGLRRRGGFRKDDRRRGLRDCEPRDNG